jgi:formate-dependent phosphoribosylglycinamide formyltransferase (GAR transformylase)
MKNVVFVAPFLAETTLRFVDAVARLGGVRSILITQDAPSRLPPALRGRLGATVRVKDALTAEGIAPAVEAVSRTGEVHRLLGALEELQAVLRAHGLPCARHALVGSAAEAEAFVDSVGYPVITKPQAGSGSRGTYRLEQPADLQASLRAMPPSPERPVLLEEFIVGEEHSFDSVSIGGEIVWHSVNDYLPTPLEVVREPWIQWCVLTPRDVSGDRYSGILNVAGDALRRLGLDTGFSHMEWFRRPDGSVAISEVGARPPGARFVNLLSHAGGFDLFHAWARLMVLGVFEAPPRPYAAGAAYLRGQGQGRVARVTGLNEVLTELGGLVVEARAPQPGQTPSGTYEGEGYLIVRHPETEVVRQALARIVTTVRVELA